MEQILNELLHMDPSTISTYVDLLFIAVAAFGLIGFIVGCIKGLYKEASTFIVTGVYFALLVFVNKFIANAIYEFDISGIVTQVGYQLPDGVSTIGQLVESYLIDMCEKYEITIGNSEQMTHTIMSIALTVINLAVYLVLLIAGIVIVFIVDLIFYLLIVKLIVPRRVREYKKKRVIGGLLAFVRYVVAFCLLLSPFTAIVNSTLGNLRDEEGKVQRTEIDNDFYNALMNVLEGYNNSTVAQAFFYIKDEDGRSIDVTLMDYITSSQIDEETVLSLYTEIGNFGALAVEAVATGAIDLANGIDYTLLLGADFVGNAIEAVANSTLIKTLLTVGVTLVVNMGKIKDKIDLTKIDFYSVNWDSTLSAVKTAYDELHKSGLVDEVLENPQGFLDEFYLDSEHAPAIKKAFEELGDNDLICQIMPPLVVSFLTSLKEGKLETTEAKRSTNFEISDELLDENTYKDIKWGSELASIYEVVENISKQYYAYQNEHLTFNKLETISTDVILNTLFGTGVDFSTPEDDSYADQYDNNVFVNGGNYSNNEIQHDLVGTKNILGVGDNTTKGLFNLQLIDAMFEHDVVTDLLNLVDLNSLLQINKDDLDLEDKVINVVKNWDKTQWKNELSCIVDVVSPIMNIVDILDVNLSVSEAKRAAQENSIDIDKVLSDDSLDCLKQVTDVLGDSKIFSDVLPDVLEIYTDNNDKELVKGLNLSDLNFTQFEGEDSSLISELRKFVDDVDDINEDLIPLVDTLLNETNPINSLVDDCASTNSVFGSLLKIIESNQILNRELKEEEINNGKHQVFTEVMVNLLGKTDDSSNSLNVYNMTDGLISIAQNTIYSFDDNENGWSNEIDALIGFIGSLKGENGENQIILDYVTGNSQEGSDLTDQIFSAGIEIERIFGKIDDSILLKEAFPNTIDNLLGDSFDSFLGTGPKFENIESWALEGTYFRQLLDNINDVKNGQDLESIDWLKVDSEVLSEEEFNLNNELKTEYQNNYVSYFLANSKINKLLTSLYNAQCVGGTYQNQGRENGVFHTMLESIMSTAFDSLGIEIKDIPEEDIISRDFDIDGNEKVVYTDDVYVSWLGNQNKNYLGEIGNISMMINAVSSLDTDTTLEDMTDTLEYINKCYILRNTLPLIIESKTENIGDSLALLEDFVDRSDFTVFHKEDLSLTPYLKNGSVIDEDSLTSNLTSRLSEIEARQEELNGIIDIMNDAESISSKLDNTDVSALKEIFSNNSVDSTNTELTSDIENILITMHDSKIFNAVSTFTQGTIRTSLTAFEYFFKYVLDNEALKTSDGSLLEVPTDQYLYQITASNAWKNSGSKLGEIALFNNGLYGVMDNPLVDILTEGATDYIEAIASTLDGDQTPIQDLLLSLHGSSILDLSTAKIVDENILEHVLSAIDYQSSGYLTNETVYQTYVKFIDQANLTLEQLKGLLLTKCSWTLEEVNKITSTEDTMKYIWMNEGKQIENLIGSLDGQNFESLDIETIDSSFVDDLTNAFRNSIGLNYLEMSDPDYSDDYRSAYQLVIIKVTNTTIDALENALSLDDNKKTTTVEMILNYDNEREVIIDLIDTYNDVSSLLNLGSIDDFYIIPYSDFTSGSSDNLSSIDLLIEVLESSSVYNYSHSDTSEERNLHERIIMKLVDTVKEGFNTSGVISNTDHTDSMDIISSKFSDEKQIVYNLARKYKDAESILKSEDIVNSITPETSGYIKSLVNELKTSMVFNYTNADIDVGGKGYQTLEQNDYSYYQQIILYMIDQVNNALSTSLLLDVEEANVYKIVLFSKELDVITNIMSAYQGVNSKFTNSNDINFGSMNDTEKDNFMRSIEGLLEPLYDSDVYHYTKSLTPTQRVSKVSQLSNLSIFEQMIYTLLNSSSGVTENLHVEHSGITYSESVSSDGDAMNLRIREVTESERIKGELHWWDLGSVKGEVTKIHNITGGDITGALDVNNLKISEIIKKPTDTEDKLLNLINSSYILHDIVPNIVNKYISTHDAEDEALGGASSTSIAVDDLIFLKKTDENGNYDYSSTRGYAGEHVNSYKIEQEYESFLDRVDHWNNDLYHVSELVKLIDSLEEAEQDIAVLYANNDSFFEELLYHLSLTETYHEIVPQITISILSEQLKIEVFILGISKVISLGALINGVGSPNKLVTFFNEVDSNSIYEDEFIKENGTIKDYSNNIYASEGKGLDEFVKTVANIPGAITPTTSTCALGALMFYNYSNGIFELSEL